MKEGLNRKKVVIRHLPPSLSNTSFFEQIDGRFCSRYNWASFRSGNSSHKNHRYSRAYLNFNTPDDVFEFSNFFNGHVFVNEKGTQYKAIVEYAPCQRVPKANVKKDGREGTIFKDSEYVEFLERISKPVENLPSADIQLERREAERAGHQEAPIVTPLMEFVRKRRATKYLGSEGKNGGRSFAGKSRASRSDKKPTYVIKNPAKSINGKDKPTYILVPQRENELDASSKNEVTENETGSCSRDSTKRKILLLKGKEQQISQVSEGTKPPKVVTLPAEDSSPSVGLKSGPDASGSIIRNILLNKDPRPIQSSSLNHSEQKMQGLNSERSRRLPRPSGSDKSSGREFYGYGYGHEKQERRTRSRERFDRGVVWTPRRSDSSRTSDENQINILDSYEAKRGYSKYEASGCNVEVTNSTGGRNSSYTEIGSYRSFGRRGPVHSAKDDGSSKRGSVGHSLHEKQVWVQKSASGS